MGKRGPKPRPFEERFWEKVQITDSCWLWLGFRDKNGYGMIRPFGSRLRKKAHRLMWEIHYGEIPEGICVCHSCDNPPCVNPEHLFLGTRKDNMQDMINKGRDLHWRGEAHGKAVLFEDDVREIRKRCAEGEGPNALAREFGVSYQNIQNIRDRKIWRWLKE